MNILTLYITDIRRLKAQEQAALPLLTPARKAAALQPQPETDRLHGIAAGLLLRHVLGICKDEELCRNLWGKPELTSKGPQFSLSHGGHYAVLGIAPTEIGVDIEPIPEKTPAISRRFLHPEELEWLKKDPSPEGFARLWTRLESVLKADGRGFSLECRDFSVLETGDWNIHTFVYDGHVISCAAKEPFELHLNMLCCDDLLKNKF